jgi:Protein of unknown function (DUF3352)
MSLSHDGEPVLDHDDWAAQVRTRSAGDSRKWLLAAVAAAVVVALSVGGVAVVNALGGGGPQPEDVLPANAIAFAKLDLNPSAGQKLAAYQLSRKLPGLRNRVTSEDTSLKESTIGFLFTGDAGLSYPTDVAPWLGDRVGVGVFPDLDADERPEVAIALAVSDKAAAKVALDKAVANLARKDSATKGSAAKGSAAKGSDTKGSDMNRTAAMGSAVGYAFADDYVILAESNARASALVIAGKAGPLSGSTYTDDVRKLGADQIAVAWVDVAAAYNAIPLSVIPESSRTAFTEAGDSKTAGRVVTGLHADSSFLEVTAMGIGVTGASAVVNADVGNDAGLIASFPSDALVAVTANGLGKSVGALYTSLTKAAGTSAKGTSAKGTSAKGTSTSDPAGIRSMLSAMGLDSAQKIETLLGAETGIMVGGPKGGRPQVAMRTRGSNPDVALAVARKAFAGAPLGGRGLLIRTISNPPGIVVGTRSARPGPDLTTSIFNRSGPQLGSTEAFRQVIDKDDKANLVAYVNLKMLLPMLARDKKSGVDMTSLTPLDALGISATGGAEPTVRIRLSFR